MPKYLNAMLSFIKGTLLVICIGIVSPSVAQTTGNSDSIFSFQTMHVHFDKDIYLPGETIWFKAYLYNVNEVSLLSTNFYAAIYNEDGKLISQKQYPIFSGSCSGDFEIPDTFNSSIVQFRAFTKAMIDDDSNNVYNKVLAVYTNKNVGSRPGSTKTITLHFFPEGGQIIAELQNYIAFKATYTDGSPAIINGQIADAVNGKIIDSFFSNTTGMGKFILSPYPRRQYKAVWKDDNGIVKETPLPIINRFGVSFHAEIIDNKLQYSIAKNKTSDSLSLLHLIAQTGNYLLYKADLVIPDEMELYTAKFAVDSFPPGLMQLTLFDKGWNTLQQRIIFLNEPKSSGLISIVRDTINTAAKGKNTITITSTDTSFVNLSVSIADAAFYSKANTHSIKQDLLLNTQLKDLNQDLNTSLQTGNNDTIDLALLTSSWKKYSWQKLRTVKEVLSDNKDHYISLLIQYENKKNTLPYNDLLNIIVSSKETGKQFYNLKQASPNSFKKDDLVFFDSVKIAYQMNNNKDIAGNFIFKKTDTLPIPSLIPALKKAVSFAASKSSQADNAAAAFFSTTHKKFNDLQTIQEVVVKSGYKGNPYLARIDELDDTYATGMFRGTVRGFALNVIDDTFGVAANHDLQDYIRYRVPGLSVLDGNIGVKRKIESKNRKGEYIIKDTIFRCITFINEVEVESSDLQNVVMSDVAYVKYIPGIVIGAGFNVVNGAIYVYTKTGKEKGPALKGLPYTYVKGYDSQKEFINPDYTGKSLLKQPDLRTTLYWNPYVILDKTNNQAKVEYFNNDISKKLILKIEGVTAGGRLIYLEQTLE